MKHKYKTTRIWEETLRNLKRIGAETGETVVAIIHRLSSVELKRIKEQQDKDNGPR